MITEPTKSPRKRCAACKDYRLLTEFHKEKGKAQGVQSYCILCKQRNNAEYQEELRQKKLKAEERKAQKEVLDGAAQARAD
jgi:predicted RND superfamily exporter protein